MVTRTPDRNCLNGALVKPEPIVLSRSLTDLLKDHPQPLRVRRAEAEEIQVFRCPRRCGVPNHIQHRALENKQLTVTGLGQSGKETLCDISHHHTLIVLMRFARNHQQAVTDRLCGVLDRPFRHDTSISAYGRMTFSMRQAVAAAASSSMVNFFSRHPSRRASMATSRPTLLRYLKQSATVLADE